MKLETLKLHTSMPCSVHDAIGDGDVQYSTTEQITTMLIALHSSGCGNVQEKNARDIYRFGHSTTKT